MKVGKVKKKNYEMLTEVDESYTAIPVKGAKIFS